MSDDPIRYWQTLTTVEAGSLADHDPVTVLPLAAIEQHGPHLPLSTDLDIGLGLLAEAFRRLPADVAAYVLPPQVIGASREHLRFAGTLSLPPEVVVESILQLGAAVAASGVRRLVVCNSHGGNQRVVDDAALQLREEVGLLVVKASYFAFTRPDDLGLPEAEWRHGLHGGAVETAMMMHLRPELVRRDAVQRFTSLGQELDGTLRHLGPEGDASFAWLAGDLNPQGVTGDATLATADIGARLVTHYGSVLAAVIQDALAFPLARLV
jgi:creatinine amidohydrolase